jgi:asparagine synthase (glutamine-hydrolysing)
MCGIAGYIDYGGESAERLERVGRAMTGCIDHRGPDASGVLVLPEHGVVLGHRRLSILDLSESGAQPMSCACGRYTTVFNGEIYNFQELRTRLLGEGERFRGTSDTEVLLAAICRWGMETALQRSNGMFALAAWDARERTLLLARDRIGEKPLYYGLHGGRFFFASELKSIRAHPDTRLEMDRSAVAAYLRFAYVPGPASIYRDIYKLPPGSWLAIPAGAPDAVARPRPYWSPTEVFRAARARPFAGSADDAVAELSALLEDSVRLRSIADVPLGAFLSGGVDSSVVVAVMQKLNNRAVRTFSIGMEDRAYDEAPHAAAVARHLGTDHTEHYVTPQEAMSLIPRLPHIYDEPFGDASQVPMLLVASLARRHVTVALSGDGGDELFAGYNRHLWGTRLWRRIGRVPRPVRRAGAAALRSLSPQRWDAVLGALGSVGPAVLRQRQPGEKLHKLAAILATPDTASLYLRLVSQWQDPHALVTSGREAPRTIIEAVEWNGADTFAESMMLADALTYMVDDILVKVDRATMAVSLEGRVPLLDPRIIEFAWSLPLEYKIRDGQSKWALRQVLYRHVPRELIERPKMGFSIPLDTWLRGPLREWAESLLDADRLRAEGFLRPEPIREVWRRHLAGDANTQYQVWVVLMFQAWLEAQGAQQRADV